MDKNKMARTEDKKKNKKPTIVIGNKKVGEGNPCFIIAEAGSNHNGRLEIAYKLVDAAVNAKADAVKFQTFRAEKLYVKDSGKADYLKSKEGIYEIIRKMEMPYDWIKKLADYCSKKDIIFLSSPFDEESADIMDKYVPAYKIASYEMTHIPLLKHIARKKKPMIMSVAMASLQEIEESITAIRKEGNEKIILLHCIASYPAPLEASNLRVIEVMMKKFDVPVGMSDHSEHPLYVPMTSVALGASVVEKHFTLDKNLPGPDHKYAVNPAGLKEMVACIRAVETVLGTAEKKVQESEKEIYSFARRAVHATADIKKGEKFNEKNIAVLRPGKIKPGIAPRYYETILGRKSKRDIKEGEGIQESYF
ncbi:MAG TPA: N-acetylneuraminate synthase family protein [Candidatus Nanoarchaeia archaeon]|nr:N-acetylneuraminate synthase family protein [Candidatus Nanoarchaeia archaeon]